MANKRSYRDPCGVARSLDLVGDRWALLVVRELLLGPKRFTDLRAGLPGLSPDVLAQRLRDLEAAGVVARRTLPAPAGSRVYELTEWGTELEPVVLALGRWGSRAPFPGGAGELGVDAFIVALRTLFDPAAAGDLEVGIELLVGDQAFVARVGGGELSIERGTAVAPDAVVEAATGALAAVLWHGRRPAEARRAGEIRLDGDRRAFERFLKLFPQAEPAPKGDATLRK